MRLMGHDLGCIRGGREVFIGVNFAVAGGEALAVTGRNGAGKTTLLRLIAGLLEVAEGRLELTGGAADSTLAEQAHYLGHRDALKPALSVRENLEFWYAFLGDRDASTASTTSATTSALETVGLGALAGLPAAYLSAGQRRRLSVARLVAVKRPIWLLDEPTSTLDASAQTRLAGLMRAHLTEGGLILAATHGAIGLESARELRLDATSPSPLVGEGRGGGSGGDARAATIASYLSTPTPNPSSQGGGEQRS